MSDDGVDFKFCKYCPEIGKQNISQFGKYQSRDKKYKNRRNKCNTCRRKDEAKRYEINPEVKVRMKKASKVSSLKIQYGISIEDLDKMCQEQENKCKICNKQLQKPNIDHCHKTGRVRGILCWNCNVGIGHLKDSVEILLNAIKYLGG